MPSRQSSGIVAAVSPAYPQTKLTRPISTKDGGVLRTVLDVGLHAVAIQELRENARWQHAVALLMAQADVDVSAGRYSCAVDDAKLDLRALYT